MDERVNLSKATRSEKDQRKNRGTINKCLNQKFQYFCKSGKKKLNVLDIVVLGD